MFVVMATNGHQRKVLARFNSYSAAINFAEKIDWTYSENGTVWDVEVKNV